MLCLLALTSALLSTAPSGSSWDALPPIQAPLGRLGDAVADAPSGGVPAGEKVVVAHFSGCERDQALYLSRFLAGVALGGNQILSWLSATGKQPALFKDPLALGKALDRGREGAFVDGQTCPGGEPADGWKLALTVLPRRLCPGPPGARSTGEFWFARPTSGPGGGKDVLADRKRLTAVVKVSEAGPGSADRCRPRLSAALFDDRGLARLRLHADYSAALEVELLGEPCRVAFVFDPAAQAFRARPVKGTRCPR